MLSNKIKEIMSREVITAKTSEKIQGVMKTLAAHDTGAVIVMEGGAPVGVFSERDVLGVMSRKLDRAKTSIEKVMRTRVLAVAEDMPIVEALGKMYRAGVRHILVRAKDGTMAGQVSMFGILRLAVRSGRDLTESRTVGSVMSRKLVTVDASQSIEGTIKVMAEKGAGCVLVLKDGEPQGIFSERDVLKRVATQSIELKKTPITKVMTPDPVIMPESALVGGVLETMYERKFRNMPIRKPTGELAGVVSMVDVLKYARALNIDESVRRDWKEIEEFWQSEENYTPG